MALSRADKLALLQEAEVDERPAGLTREQKIALLEQEETPKPKAGLRDDVTFLGSEKLGEFMSGIFPRTAKSVAEGESYGKQVLGAGLDQLSAGRAVASLPEFRKGGRAYMESLADTEGDSFVGKTLRDPGTGAALLTAPVGGAALGAMRGTGLATRLAAGAGVGAMEGAASAAAHQGERVNRGQGVDLGAAALETGVSAVAPAVIGGVLKGGLKLANKALGKAAQEFSGVSEEALRAYGTGLGQGAKELRAAAGTQHQVGQKLVTMLDDLDSYLPEKQVVDQALHQMPAVNVANTIQQLQGAKTGGALSSSRATNAKIEELVSDLTGAADPQGNIPAATFRQIRKEIDELVGDAFGKESNKYVSALKEARHQMADDLTATAQASGKPEYAEAMRSMAQKLRKADDLKAFLGKSAQTREQRAESFISTLFGKNKEERRKAVKAMGEIFGEDFLRESKLASLAAELGDGGKPGLIPRQFNGRSLLGPVGGGGAGFLAAGAPGAVVGASLSSPRLAAGILSGVDALESGVSLPAFAPTVRYGSRTPFRIDEEE